MGIARSFLTKGLWLEPPMVLQAPWRFVYLNAAVRAVQ